MFIVLGFEGQVPKCRERTGAGGQAAILELLKGG
mgnify:CR=1 FL=1